MLSHHSYLPQKGRFLRANGIMRHGTAKTISRVSGKKWVLPLVNGLKVDTMKVSIAGAMRNFEKWYREGCR